MKAFNLVATKNNSGTKTFVVNFLDQINKTNIGNQIVIFISKSYFDMLGKELNQKIKYKVKSDYFDNFILRSIWLHFFLPFELKTLGIKILFSPLNYCPLFIKLFNIKSILFVHTVMPWEYPHLLPGGSIKNELIKKLMEFSIRISEKVIVPSEYAKSIIAKITNKKNSAINVVYLGADHISKSENQKFELKNFDYEQKYIFSVLSCVKYHNIINLLEAYKFLKNESKIKFRFVLVLKILDKSYYLQIKNFIKENFLEDQIIIFKDLDNKYLYNLYKNSDIYIFSSYSETFGFSTLEAMEFNIPSLVSETSALKEINGDYPIYFDPDNVKDIGNRLLNITLHNETVLDSINIKQKKKYTWKKCFEEIFEIICK